jgi:tetratricopeptide (TPR) repeat protein
MVEHYPVREIAPDPEIVRSRLVGDFDGEDYVGAWMLVHVMVLGDERHRKALEGYLNELRTGRMSESESLEAHFDQKMLSEIDAAYVAFQRRTSTSTQAIALDKPPTLALATRAVPEAEALAIRGRLWRPRRPDQMLALQDANRAISIDPKSAEGYLLRANLLLDADNRSAAARDLRTALRLAPDDPRVRRGLGSVLLALDGPTAEVKELVDWVRQRSASALDYRFLASFELRSNHPDRALDLAKRGTSLDTWCVACYELAADAALRSGDREGAVRWQRQAINVAAHNATPAMREELARFENPVKSADDVIHARIRAERPAFDACYEAAVAKNSTLRGKVTISFVVGADGSVTETSDAGSELRDPEMIGCVARVLRAMKFEPPANGARTLRHWFRFPKKAD